MPELADLLAECREPAFRARQLYDGLFRQRRPLEELTALPAELRTRLAETLPLSLEALSRSSDRSGGVTKWLWRVSGGAQVETVLMHYPGRATVCVSTQAGCAMGCTFCATGQAGFERHLGAAEIVEQVARAAHWSLEPITNVVFMGMGEPLANYEATLASVERLHDDLGISARRIVVSTVGVVPGMRRLAQERLPVTLAVSLHAPDDELRDQLVPLNRRYPIGAVLEAAREYAARKGRRVSFEYAMISGVNDRPVQARSLARRLSRMAAHVNLIPLNPTAGFIGRASSPADAERFAEVLREFGVNATIRRNRGTGIDAACGQLRARGPSDRPRADRPRADRPRADRPRADRRRADRPKTQGAGSVE